jgi:flagellar biosynthesis/type III secretory pathway M-ring protein FliF/YscJ
MVLIRLINEANFFVVFIALIIAFFLLGIIVGNMMNRPKKDPKERTKDAGKEPTAEKQQTDTFAQDNQDVKDNPDTGQDQRSKDPRTRYYNWW